MNDMTVLSLEYHGSAAEIEQWSQHELGMAQWSHLWMYYTWVSDIEFIESMQWARYEWELLPIELRSK